MGDKRQRKRQAARRERTKRVQRQRRLTADQLETVRRILRDFHGRVLLADEVGLGKTIEACLALKEYWMRGLVRKALVLTPPSLVGQPVAEHLGEQA